MPAEHSAGAIVFRRERQRILYLLLHYEEGHWGSPKGHIEPGETIESTARREIREETGLTGLHILEGFKETDKYFFVRENQRIFKTVVFFLAETSRRTIRLSFEHIGYVWLPYEEALTQITFKTEREILRKAHEFLLKKYPVEASDGLPPAG